MPPFTTEPFQRRIEKPWGFEIIFAPTHLRRCGKILFVKAGNRLSFQYHDEKEETLCLFSGQAIIWLENAQGEIEKKPMEAMKGYTVSVGQKHRIEAVKDSFLFEVSDPEKGNTFRVEDDYSRGTETEEVRGRRTSSAPVPR